MSEDWYKKKIWKEPNSELNSKIDQDKQLLIWVNVKVGKDTKSLDIKEELNWRTETVKIGLLWTKGSLL